MSFDINLGLLEKYNKSIPRYTSYPTAVEWTDEFSESDYRGELISLRNRDITEPFSLYFHIPFCAERCYYCGCHVIIDKNRHYVSKYLEYLGKELELFTSVVGKGRAVSQLHFGGGTPTFLNVEELDKLFSMIGVHFDISGASELAIEIDPCVTSREQIKFLKGLGFNRLSMGVQDFDSAVQKAVNRGQDYKETVELIDYSRSLGFSGINLDFIYGLPFQTVSSFSKTVDKLIALDIDRVALFSYAKVPWLKPHQKRIRDEDIPSLDEKHSIFLMSRSKLLSAGYIQIGMDHFAKREDELSLALSNKSLHRNFMGYTVGSLGDYLGFGVSSIGYVGRSFVQNIKTLRKYYEELDKGLLPISRGMILSDDDLMRKWVIEALMCQFELDYSLFYKEFNKSFSDYFSFELGMLDGFIEDGLLSLSDARITITEKGSLFVRNVASTFDIYLRTKKERRFSKAI